MLVHPAAVVAGGRVRRLRLGKVRHIEPAPTFLGGIPPDVLLALRPWLSRRIGRGAVVEDATISRPGEAPLRCHVVVRTRLAVAGQVLPRLGEDTAVDPDAASGGAVLL